MDNPDCQRKFWIDCVIPICGSFKHSMGTEKIDKLSGNTFGTRPSDRVIIGAGPNHSTIFGTVPKIRVQSVQTIVLYLVPLQGFDP